MAGIVQVNLSPTFFGISSLFTFFILFKVLISWIAPRAWGLFIQVETIFLFTLPLSSKMEYTVSSLLILTSAKAKVEFPIISAMVARATDLFFISLFFIFKPPIMK